VLEQALNSFVGEMFRDHSPTVILGIQALNGNRITLQQVGNFPSRCFKNAIQIQASSNGLNDSVEGLLSTNLMLNLLIGLFARRDILKING
jgi:hypothetical protein